MSSSSLNPNPNPLAPPRSSSRNSEVAAEMPPPRVNSLEPGVLAQQQELVQYVPYTVVAGQQAYVPPRRYNYDQPGDGIPVYKAETVESDSGSSTAAGDKYRDAETGKYKKGYNSGDSTGSSRSETDGSMDDYTGAPADLHKFRTSLTMFLITHGWFVHLAIIMTLSYVMTFYIPQFYIDDEMWNTSCWWKLGWFLPLPYTIVCFVGLIMPMATMPKYDEIDERELKQREVDNLYICIVTRGSNKEAVYRSYNAMRHLEEIHPSVHVHVLTDEPYYYPDINCWSCPKAFTTGKAMYKARALEWYRRQLKLTENDWILHLDEESVIDAYGIRRCLEFIWYTTFEFGQGVIFYNQYRYWKNWLWTTADAIRVGDDLSRFQLQYSYFHKPIFGAHGSFLLTNGVVENSVTWDLASLTEDFEFAVNAWGKGYRCGQVPAIVREQSPQTFMDFMKQRRRWYCGIIRLPFFLPKLWGFFWTLGTLCLYFTILGIILGIIYPMGTPRWMGAIKDFSFAVFVYNYVLGIFIQNVDYGMNFFLVLLLIPATIVLQFIAVILECFAVMYAIVKPARGFDIIKK